MRSISLLGAVALSACGSSEATLGGATRGSPQTTNFVALDATAGALDKCSSSAKQLSDPQSFLAADGAGWIEEPVELAVNDTDLYYLARPSLGPDVLTIVRVPLNGDRPTIVGSANGQDLGMALTSTSVLVSTDVSGAGNGGGDVLRFPLAGGSPAVLVHGPAGLIGVDAQQNLYFLDSVGIKAIPVDGGVTRTLAAPLDGQLILADAQIVILEPMSGTVSALPTDGGQVLTLATNQNNATSPIACGADICWITEAPSTSPGPIGTGTGSLVRLGAGEAPEVVFTDASLFGANRAAFDGSHFIVLAGNFEPRLVTFAAQSSAVSGLGSGVYSFVYDDHCLYWADAFGISAIAKP